MPRVRVVIVDRGCVALEGTRFPYFRARIVAGEFGTGTWPDHAERGEDERALSGTYRPTWVALGERGGKGVRPTELARRVLEHG